MTPMTRICCAILSTVGAAGLIAFANPASGLNMTSAASHAAVQVAASTATAHRG